MNSEERRAAAARRAAAEKIGEQRGDAAFQQFRSAAPSPTQRREPSVGQQLRGEPDVRNGKPMLHTTGYFTTYERGYPMWDDHGQYTEMTMRGSGRDTLASKPDLGFLVNHKGTTMARTKTGTLLLAEDSHGGSHEAWMNLERQDVKDLAEAIKDGDIDEMSFAFYIPDGSGMWSDDFSVFQILAYDLERGDVSAVNYGANPFTDIASRAGTILRELDQLPEGARRAARQSLAVADIERQTEARERIALASRVTDHDASPHVRRLQWVVENTSRRLIEAGEATGMSLAELRDARLPWYEIRAAESDPDTEGGEATVVETDHGEATDVLIYDEIGGSFGTSAQQFAADLAAITTPQINLRINSPGGSVRDAIAIASSMRHHASHISAFVDGWAASAASVLMLAADEVVVMPGGEIMAHSASMQANANAREFDQLAMFLRKQDQNIAQQYADKAGGTQEQWLAIMDEETWFLANEAVEAGLADRVWSAGNRKRGERSLDDPRLTRKWSGEQYRYRGRADAPVTQIRRAFLAEGNPDARRIVGEAIEQAEARRPEVTEAAPVTPENGSTAPVAMGRSITLIEALLDLDEEQ